MDNSDFAPTLRALRGLDSCAVANAIETLNVRLRNEGYTDRSLLRQTGGNSVMLGFAATIKIRTASPPPDKKSYFEHHAWLELLDLLPRPRVLVIEEADSALGSGAFIGEVHASILQAMDCIGVVTNGAIRDIARLEEMDFAAYSTSLSVSHSYAHIVEYGHPITVAGLKVNPGDLLHGDRHGVVSIPLEIAQELPRIARELRATEERIIAYCESPDFRIDRLNSIITG